MKLAQPHHVVAGRVVGGVVDRPRRPGSSGSRSPALAADAHERVQEVLVAEAEARHEALVGELIVGHRRHHAARPVPSATPAATRCAGRARSARCRASCGPDRDVDLRPEQALDQRPAQAAVLDDLQEVHGKVEDQQLEARPRSRSPGPPASARRSRACSGSCPSRPCRRRCRPGAGRRCAPRADRRDRDARRAARRRDDRSFAVVMWPLPAASRCAPCRTRAAAARARR